MRFWRKNTPKLEVFDKTLLIFILFEKIFICGRNCGLVNYWLLDWLNLRFIQLVTQFTIFISIFFSFKIEISNSSPF